MGNPLSPELREYLKRCGLSENKISQCHSGTRMHHDLGLYGDVAESYMEILRDQFHVDLSGFEFEKFFPPEFAGGNWLIRTLLWIVPFAGQAARRRTEFLPLTLEMVDEALRHKRFR